MTQTINTTADQLIHWLLDESPESLTVFGQEKGFNEEAGVIRAADGADLNAFWREVQETIRLRNESRKGIIDFLTVRTNETTEEVTVPSEVEFEEASEYGQPEGIRGTAKRFFRGADFKFWDLGIRYTWMALADMGQQQLQMNHNLALEADIKLQFRRVMTRLFNPLNGAGFTDLNEAVTVFAAYNGDGEVPPAYKQNKFDGQHNHYLTTGSASVTSAAVDRMADDLAHHGYTLPNGYKMILWVNKQEADIIGRFRVTLGDKYDFVPNQSLYNGAVWVPTDGRYVGGPTGVVPGEIGTYGPFHVVVEDYVPAGYMAAITTGGADNLANPIAFREHSNPAYRGLKVIPGQRSDYPLVDSFYRRGMGTGVRHRGSIVLMQVKEAGVYSIPALYDPAAA